MPFQSFLLTSDTLYSVFGSYPKSNHCLLWSVLQCTQWSGLGCGVERGGNKCLYVLPPIWDGECTAEVVGWWLEVGIILCCGNITLGLATEQRCMCLRLQIAVYCVAAIVMCTAG